MKRPFVLERELLLFDFDMDQLNREAANIAGTSQLPLPTIEIKPIDYLGCILLNKGNPIIYLHSLINVPWLPEEVMLHILVHEHIHRIVPGREVEPGVYKSHPPEFWEMERELSPNARTAWCWIRMEWNDLLVRDPKMECIRVKKNWKSILKQKRATQIKLCKEAGMPPPPESGISWFEAQIRSTPADDNPFLIASDAVPVQNL